MNKVTSGCVKPVRTSFFGFHEYNSVLWKPLQLGLQSFDAIVHNADVLLTSRRSSSDNSLGSNNFSVVF